MRMNFRPKILLLCTTVGIILGMWLSFTPPGLLGKADAVGYAVCHRISSRSFFFGERQTPLCARCNGMYLGAAAGLLYQFRRKHAGGMPPLKISLALGLFLIAFGLDGINSYLRFFPDAPGLYAPQNWLRLATGIGLGSGMAAIVYPTFNQTIWKEWSSAPALGGWNDLAVILATGALLGASMYSENPLLVYPLAVIGSATILVILSMVYTMVWVLIRRRENRFPGWDEVTPYLIAGFGTAILQIAVMDAGRYWLTGTWDGFFVNQML